MPASSRSPATSMVGKRPYERNVGLLFQHYALFPHMTVAENVAYGLKHRGWPKAEIPERVGEMLRLVQLKGFEARRPGQLSGGQQQRVALARVLATRPQLVLLDEPLSALDAKLREELRLELKQILTFGRLDDDRRHPRPGRGDEPRRPHHRDESRPHRAAGHAGRDLHAAADAVRRRLHRPHQLVPRQPLRRSGRRLLAARHRGRHRARGPQPRRRERRALERLHQARADECDRARCQGRAVRRQSAARPGRRRRQYGRFDPHHRRGRGWPHHGDRAQPRGAAREQGRSRSACASGRRTASSWRRTKPRPSPAPSSPDRSRAG